MDVELFVENISKDVRKILFEILDENSQGNDWRVKFCVSQNGIDHQFSFTADTDFESLEDQSDMSGTETENVALSSDQPVEVKIEAVQGWVQFYCFLRTAK